jgi:hypothetical protein
LPIGAKAWQKPGDKRLDYSHYFKLSNGGKQIVCKRSDLAVQSPHERFCRQFCAAAVRHRREPKIRAACS